MVVGGVLGRWKVLFRLGVNGFCGGGGGVGLGFVRCFVWFVVFCVWESREYVCLVSGSIGFYLYSLVLVREGYLGVWGV